MTPSDPAAAQDFFSLVRQSRQVLEGLMAFGLTTVPGKKETAPCNSSKIPMPTPASGGSKANLLEPIRQKALACTACRLAKGRHSVVFGEGSLDAQLVFVGEGPGRDEDAQGRPFVGMAGQLLTKMIVAMELKREEVYIANVVKCRPPENRVPEPDEIAACAPFLEAQLTTIQPKVICTLGRTAVTSLLQTEAPMGFFRGKSFEWKGIPVVATYHPAYLLRNPSAKTQTWADLQQVIKILKE